MIEKWKKTLDNKKHAGEILTDLSNAFDCINHELLIAKLDTYDFDKKCPKIYTQLHNRKEIKMSVGTDVVGHKYR